MFVSVIFTESVGYEVCFFSYISVIFVTACPILRSIGYTSVTLWVLALYGSLRRKGIFSPRESCRGVLTEKRGCSRRDKGMRQWKE